MKGNRQSIRYWLFPFIITYLERMNKELTSYDKIATVLFKGHEEAASLLSCRELMQKDRWMLCVSKLLEDPMTADKDLIAFLMAGCDGSCEPVSQATAYRDLAAREAKDPKGIAANADKIGKYTRSDKEDDDIDRSAWEPPCFEPSDDVTLMGDDFKPILNLEEERKSFRALFKQDHDIVDIEPITDDYGTDD